MNTQNNTANNADFNCKIFVSYHKPAELIKSNILTPIHVGRALAKNNPNYSWMKEHMIGDDTGDNISEKNPNYCELTAQYWAWKNCDADYIGFFHYRRFLDLADGAGEEIEKCNPENYIEYGWDTKNIQKLSKEYDIILPEVYYVHPTDLPKDIMSPYKFYKRDHNIEDLDIIINIIKNDYPEFIPAMEDYLYGAQSVFFNMFIMRKDLFNNYCSWLFDILEKSEKYIKISENSYQKRVFGFLAERLLNIYVLYLQKENPMLKVLNTKLITVIPEVIKFDKNKFQLGQQIYLKEKQPLPIERKIEVVFATDNCYCRHCCSAIASILLNADSSSTFHFHILDGGLDKAHQAKLLSLKRIRNFEMSFYDMKQYDFSQFKHNRKHISEATYYRLYLTELLPKEIDKVIYLDCDIIVEKDLKNLWDIDISKYYAGVVEDEGSVRQQRRLKLPSENKYFNAGVLLLNIKILRNFDFKKACLTYFYANESIITLQDQDILNGVFNGKCKFLPLCWNANGRIYQGNNLEKSYSREEEIEAGYNPSIIHFTDVNKPWKYTCQHPLKEEYWKYLNYTNYKDKVFLHLIRNACTFFFNFNKTKTEDIATIFNIPIYNLQKGKIKALKIFGIPLYSRKKSRLGRTLKILWFKEKFKPIQ